MYVESVPNRSSPPAILLRESSRSDGKIVKRTVANLSSWPATQIDALRRVMLQRPRRTEGYKQAWARRKSAP